ncbi:unnamed protein product [Moneuplotes crassus]|uniref:Uncharacterized protein n=1 Tax=Euplotes crassus TaxID=5936 RepID=A0AAD1Y9E9_EUPCR|nr:unnamed protein product [Moneuplotes crassus]
MLRCFKLSGEVPNLEESCKSNVLEFKILLLNTESNQGEELESEILKAQRNHLNSIAKILEFMNIQNYWKITKLRHLSFFLEQITETNQSLNLCN